MPDYWQVPTVSMGLGPIQAIYQAQFLKYLEARGLMPKSDRKVWCFLGDGEVDEPESLGAISVAGREGLDNLIFVINCNLQRLDGPVRGNGKIIQELEGGFRGAGWNVIKLIWGSYWDPLLARDTDGVLRKLMMETVDGEYQACKALGGAYTREHFFDKYPQTREMVASLSDEDVWRLNRGGHDPHKVYAAYHAAVHTKGMPTVILAKTVKGYGMGSAGESMNIAHQAKKMDRASDPAVPRPLSASRSTTSNWPATDRNRCPITTRARIRRKCSTCWRAAHGAWWLPAAAPREIRGHAAGTATGGIRAITKGTGEREISNTMALVRGMNLLLRDKQLAPRWCRSSPTRRARSAWKACSARSASTRRSARSTSRRMPTSCCITARTRRARCCRKASPRPAACSAWIAAATSYSVSPISRCCRSSSTTRCSASSASAICAGPPATCTRAAS